MEIRNHDSLIRLGRLNGTFQRLDSKYLSRSLTNLSRIARMTLARSTRLPFIRPSHRLERFQRITYNFSERTICKPLSTATTLASVQLP